MIRYSSLLFGHPV